MSDVYTIDIAKTKILIKLIERYREVLLPFTRNCHYDIAIVDDKRIFRIRCVLGKVESAAIRFTTQIPEEHKDQIEFFGIYCKHLDKSYLVPTHAINTKQSTLRLIDYSYGSRGLKASTYEL